MPTVLLASSWHTSKPPGRQITRPTPFNPLLMSARDPRKTAGYAGIAAYRQTGQVR